MDENSVGESLLEQKRLQARILAKMISKKPPDKVEPADLTNCKDSLKVCLKAKDVQLTFELLQVINPILLRQSDWEAGRQLNQEWRALARETDYPVSETQQADLSYWLGIFNDSLGDKLPAEQEMLNSLRLAQAEAIIAQKDAGRQARAYLRLGWLAHQRKDFAAAEALYGQAEAAWQQTEGAVQTEGLGRVAHHRGMLAYDRGRLEEAERLFLQSICLRELIGDDWQTAASLYHLGLLAGRRGNPRQADEYLTRCLILRRKIHDWDGLDRVTYQMGVMQRSPEKPEPAANLPGDMRREHLPEQRKLSAFLSGMQAWDRQDYPAARADLMIAQRWAIETGDLYTEGQVTYQLGLVDERLDNPVEAAVCYQASAAIFQQIGKRVEYAHAIYQEALLGLRDGDLGEACRKLEECLDMYQQNGLQRESAQTLFHLGRAWILQQDFEQAAYCFQHSAAAWEAVGDTRRQLTVLKWLGDAYRACHQREQARQVYQQGIEIARRAGLPDDVF